MKMETELKLQAHLDGELTPAESREVDNLLASDAGARELLAELTLVQKCMAGNEPEARVPETREFYWSKIQREIGRSANPTPVRRGWLQVFKAAWCGPPARWLESRWPPSFCLMAGGSPPTVSRKKSVISTKR